MNFKRAIPKCTPDQQARQDRCRLFGCICCRMNYERGKYGCAPTPHEINHQTRNGRQISQDATECLCQWHHRGICVPGITSSKMRCLYGPSLAKGSKTFCAEYGTNEERIAYQNRVIR